MTRFIILASTRTGTTVVGNALADHPAVLYFGVLFHYLPARRAEEAGRITIGAGVTRSLSDGVPFCREGDDRAAYVQRVLGRTKPGVGAVGFKLFYAQARRGPNASVWDYLDADLDLRIVHVRRDNWLESLVSQERAARTNVWHTRGATDSEPFAIAPARCLRFFERKARALAAAEAVLRAHAVLEVEYAEIAGEFPTVPGEHLPLSRRRSHSGRRCPPGQDRAQALHEELSNFEALLRHFSGTPYERFFAQSDP